MKPFLTLLGLHLLFSLSSCVTFKQFDDEAKKGRTPEYNVFIQKKDGQKVVGNKFSQSSVWSSGYWIAVDGVKVSDYNVYQNEKAYYVLTDVAGWVQRLRYGKMNLYYYDDSKTDINGKHPDFTAKYVFEKEKGKFEKLTYEGFANAIQDNPEAAAKFKQQFPHGKIPKDEKGNLYNLIATVEVYNK
jgi:hypothetical protein